MKKTRKVTRTWKRKSGEIVTKTYEYEVKGTKSKLLVNNAGRVYKNRLKEFTKQYSGADVYDIEAYIDFYSVHKKRLSEQTLRSKLADSKYEKMFINVGRSPEELAKQLGTTVEELTNDKNWDGSKLTINGAEYLFEFRYSGDVLMRVK